MRPEGKTIALLVAAGTGSRAGGGVPKQYRLIAGKAVLAHAIDRLRHRAIDEVRVVIGVGQEQAYGEAIRDRPLLPPVIGGETRRQSVRNGLEAIAAESGAAVVLIHDAARPFLPPAVIERLLSALDAHDAAVPVLPLADTVAEAGEKVGEAVDRERLRRVQTPQAFHFETILRAHRACDTEPTDDAQVARLGGIDVVTVPGDPALDKLTYEEDFARAEAALAARLVTRTGLGFDVHAFAEGKALWLAGLQIPHSRGLKGHSDADVALHAVTDAILGALCAGDIGDHFPPSDPQWSGAASSLFIEKARSLVEESGGVIDHVDLTIIAEEPRIGPHRLAMRQSLAALLRVPLARISIKATTTERLGFTGRGEGMAAQAVATIRLPEEI
jgi:2-C-methyl-D-erythritol 4-phosphate cytidylyltransferase/2-C-methyl-D-erythritol 2,4-cyclodiphosphate synthase